MILVYNVHIETKADTIYSKVKHGQDTEMRNGWNNSDNDF